LNVTFFEVVGFFWICSTSILGTVVIGSCAWRGAKGPWLEHKRDRLAQRDFDRRVMGE